MTRREWRHRRVTPLLHRVVDAVRRAGPAARAARRLARARGGRARSVGLGPKISARPLPPAAVEHAPLAGRAARRCAVDARHEDQRARPARRREVDHRHAGPAACARPSSAGNRTSGSSPTRSTRPAPTWRTSRPSCSRTSGWPAIFPTPSAAGLSWRNNSIVLAQRRDDRGLRHRPADPRPAAPPASADADRLRRPAERRPHPLGPAARALAKLVPRHADEGRHGADERRQPGHGPAPRGAGDGTAPHARLDLAAVSVDRPLAGKHLAVAAVGGHLHRSGEAELQGGGADSSTSGTARRWTPARSCSGPRKRTCTR